MAADIGVTTDIANDKVVYFFATKDIRVQPVGLQGKIYTVIRTCQNYLSMNTATDSVSALKTGGYTGLKIITEGSGPLVFVGVTYLGAIVLCRKCCR